MRHRWMLEHGLQKGSPVPGVPAVLAIRTRTSSQRPPTGHQAPRTGPSGTHPRARRRDAAAAERWREADAAANRTEPRTARGGTMAHSQARHPRLREVNRSAEHSRPPPTVIDPALPSIETETPEIRVRPEFLGRPNRQRRQSDPKTRSSPAESVPHVTPSGRAPDARSRSEGTDNLTHGAKR